MLKIDHIQFDSNLYEKHVAVDVISGNCLDANKTPLVRDAPTPSPTINDVGVPPAPHRSHNLCQDLCTLAREMMKDGKNLG